MSVHVSKWEAQHLNCEYFNMATCECLNFRTCKYLNTSLCKCLNIPTCGSLNTSIYKCHNICIYECFNLSTCECLNISTCKCLNISTWQMSPQINTWYCDIWTYKSLHILTHVSACESDGHISTCNALTSQHVIVNITTCGYLSVITHECHNTTTSNRWMNHYFPF